MAIPEDILQELKSAQTLCDDLLAEQAELQRAISLASALQEKRVALEEFYSERWLQIVERADLTQDDWHSLMVHAQPGNYSVLDQDTIWDALKSVHTTQVELLKELARAL